MLHAFISTSSLQIAGFPFPWDLAVSWNGTAQLQESRGLNGKRIRAGDEMMPLSAWELGSSSCLTGEGDGRSQSRSSGRGSAHCTLHTANCTLHTTHCILYTSSCTMHTTHCKLSTAPCTFPTGHYPLYQVCCLLCSAPVVMDQGDTRALQTHFSLLHGELNCPALHYWTLF